MYKLLIANALLHKRILLLPYYPAYTAKPLESEVNQITVYHGNNGMPDK